MATTPPTRLRLCRKPEGVPSEAEGAHPVVARRVKPYTFPRDSTSSNLMGSSRLRSTNPCVWASPKPPVVTCRVNPTRS